MTYIYTEYDYLAHHGIKGMKWGVRRFQNEDGSLKSAGEKRYYGSSKGSTRSSGRSDSVKKRKGMSSRTKKALAIAGVAAGTAALAYGVHRYRKAHGSGGNDPDAFLRGAMNQKLNPERREKLLQLEQKRKDAMAERRRKQAAKAANRDPDAFLRGAMNSYENDKYKGIMGRSRKYYEEAKKQAKEHADESIRVRNEGASAEGRLKNLLDSRDRAAKEAAKYRFKDDDISKRLAKRAESRYKELSGVLDKEELSLRRSALTGDRYSKAHKELSDYYDTNAERTLYGWKQRGYKTRMKRADGSSYYSRLPALKKRKAPTGNSMKMLRRI